MGINPFIVYLRGDIITAKEKREEAITLKNSRNVFARAFLKTLQAYQLDRSLEKHPEVFAMARAFILSTDYENLTNRKISPSSGEYEEKESSQE